MKLTTYRLIRRGRSALLALTVGSLAACSYTNGYEPTPCNMPAVVSYKTDVLPILTQNCYRCHSADKYKLMAQGVLNMEDFGKLQYYANPANGLNNTSFVVGNIRHDPGFIAMPYDGGKLNDCQIAIITAWVDAGALSN